MASAATTPQPPTEVITTTRGPFGRGWVAKVAAVSKASSMVAAVPAPMGLRLAPEKTCVVHIDDGFDFLGFHIRRMRRRGSNKWFVYTKPSKKAIASIKSRVKTMTYRATRHRDPGYLLDYLGRVLRG